MKLVLIRINRMVGKGRMAGNPYVGCAGAEA